jgi:hypothetical protein
LALLALFYPLLLALSALGKANFGHGFSALGFLPSLLALTLYSMLPSCGTAPRGSWASTRRSRKPPTASA